MYEARGAEQNTDKQFRPFQGLEKNESKLHLVKNELEENWKESIQPTKAIYRKAKAK